MIFRKKLFQNLRAPVWPILILGASLAACGDDAAQSAATESGVTNETRKEAIEKYQAEVKQRVSSSIVSAFSRDWEVSEAKVECVLADLEVTQLSRVDSDADVAAVFDECGVDPAVVK